MGYRYSPPSPTPVYPTRVHLLPTRPALAVADGWSGVLNSAVGLKSVDQLTLHVHFSDIRGITEGYNPVKVGRINNH